MYQPNPYNNPYGTPPPPPAYYPPPPPQQSSGGPMIINLGGGGHNDTGTPCPTCCRNTQAFPRKTIGFVAIAWCICLSMFIGVFGLIALCTQSFMDTQLVCSQCQTVKQVIPANMC